MNKISYILLLAVVFLTQTISAQETTDADSQAKLVKIEYQSIDEFNKPVTLSATITMPTSGTAVSNIILSSTSRNRISSLLSSKANYITPWASVVNKGVAVVEPENFVSGESKLRAIPKFAYDLAGRQSVDALLAAISYLKENGMVQESEYTSYIVGYGLGANVAIAAQRSLQTDYTAEKKAEARVKSSFYSNASDAPAKIWDEALAGGSSYSAYNTILMLDNVLKTYAEGCMKSFSAEDVFSQKLLDSRIIDFIYSDSFSETQVEQMMQTFFGTTNPSIDQLVSSDLMNENAAVRRAVEKALAMNDVSTSALPQNCIDLSQVGQGLLTLNENVKQIVQTLEQTIITKEDLFLSTVFQRILNEELINVPIMFYYSGSILYGSLTVKRNLNLNINVSMYSLFLEKTADLSLTLTPDIMSTLGGKLPGKVDIGYYGRGWIGMGIDANNVIPFVKNISNLLGSGSIQSEEEADAAAEQMNGALNTFDIAINEVPNWFTGSFCSAKDSDTGAYRIDLLFNREGRSISLATIKRLL